jgi:hypothetical protein
MPTAKKGKKQLTATLLEAENLFGDESSDEENLLVDDDDLQLLGSAPLHVEGDPNVRLWRLYVSHACTAWTMRMWEFAVALMLMAVAPDSMLLPAIYSLVISIAVTLFSTPLGMLRTAVYNRL